MTSCQDSSKLRSSERLVSIIEQKILTDDQNIDFSNIDLIDWDGVMFFGPYSNLEIFNSSSKLDLKNIEHNLIKDHDSFYLIVFLKNEKSIAIAEIDMKFPEFADQLVVVKRSDAIFYKEGDLIVLKN